MGTDTLTDTFCTLRRKLHSVANRILKDEMEAEDAVQDTFCNLWTADLPETPDEARFRLFAVLRNVCLNKLRRRRPSVGIEFLDRAIDHPFEEDAELLQKALLDSLPRMQREVFRLSVYEYKEYEEISEILGINIEAVRTNMCRARKTVRNTIKNLDASSKSNKV